MKYKNLEVPENQPTKENPFVVADYPYGFRLRTQIRYWIDTTSYGQRFVSQTLNPKTNEWNKPKYSTYSRIVVFALDEKNYATSIHLDSAYRSLEEIKPQLEALSSVFSDYQQKQSKAILGLIEVLEGVEVKFVESTCWTDEQHEEHDKKQKEINREINKLAFSNIVSKGLTVEEAQKIF
jgi:hypothetical protein